MTMQILYPLQPTDDNCTLDHSARSHPLASHRTLYDKTIIR